MSSQYNCVVSTILFGQRIYGIDVNRPGIEDSLEKQNHSPSSKKGSKTPQGLPAPVSTIVGVSFMESPPPFPPPKRQPRPASSPKLSESTPPFPALTFESPPCSSEPCSKSCHVKDQRSAFVNKPAGKVGQTRLALQRERTSKMDLSDLRGHMHLSLAQAAENLGVCISLVKKGWRRNGIARWPGRKIRFYDRHIADIEIRLADPANAGNIEGLLQELVHLKNCRESALNPLPVPTAAVTGTKMEIAKLTSTTPTVMRMVVTVPIGNIDVKSLKKNLQ